MHEQKYRYFIDGKEISTREEYFNTTMSGDYVSYFDGDSVFSVSFSNFFGENKDNNKMIKREVNSHLSDVLDLVQVKGSSTRHKSQNGETHKELTVEEKLKIAEGFKKEALKQLNITLEDIKTQSSQSYYTSQEQKEKIKADWIDFIGNGMKRGKTINYENSAEKTEKEENLVFPKNSEIHKEENKNCNWTRCGQIECKHCYPNKEFRETKEAFNKAKKNLPPFTTNYSYNYIDKLKEIYSGETNILKTFTVDEGVNEGVKLNIEGVKESNGKTDYSEIDWDFIESLAKRMNKNKSKYEAGNYKKPMNIDLLKQSLLRHTIEVLKNNYQDDGDDLGHLSAIALNAQFLHYQLKNNQK